MPVRKTHILAVDDDIAILKLLSTSLRTRGYGVTTVTCGLEALKLLETEFFDLIILDLKLPRLDGMEVCQRIREWSKVPIIMLSANGDEASKVGCLESGADDYMTKPFSINELVARVKSTLRRTADVATPISANLTCGALRIEVDRQRVTFNGNELKLTPTEYFLLQELAINANKVLTHRNLLQKVWGTEYSDEREYLRVFINRLRKKLGDDPVKPERIVTVRGVGYSFVLAS